MVSVSFYPPRTILPMHHFFILYSLMKFHTIMCSSSLSIFPLWPCKLLVENWSNSRNKLKLNWWACITTFGCFSFIFPLPPEACSNFQPSRMKSEIRGDWKIQKSSLPPTQVHAIWIASAWRNAEWKCDIIAGDIFWIVGGKTMVSIEIMSQVLGTPALKKN